MDTERPRDAERPRDGREGRGTERPPRWQEGHGH